MNKAGSGPGGAGTGPTAASATAAAQKQKALLQRVDNDVNNIVDNFTSLVNCARVFLLFIIFCDHCDNVYLIPSSRSQLFVFEAPIDFYCL